MPAENEIEHVADLCISARRVVALSGAGISVDSGIPDFRSPGGIWERYDPREYATIQAFRRDPIKVWGFLRELITLLTDKKPNPGHLALSALQKTGHLDAIITQNIDGLHQAAGSTNVIEIHGDGQTLRCLRCDHRVSQAQGLRWIAQDPQGVPRCPRCQEPLKPDVVMFGELLSGETLQRCQTAALRADLMLLCGTSAEVAPASELPLLALSRGGSLVEANLRDTHLSRSCAVVLRGSTSQTLPALANAIQARMAT